MKIKQPIAFTNQGQRDYNEDFVYPTSTSQDTKLFLVCDGMGGLDKGEEASKITAITIHDFLKSQSITKETIHQAITLAHENLKEFIDANPSLTRMGTTLTLLNLEKDEATVAHVGDSRIYHIGQGVIKYKSRDHKQVLDMVDAGIITAEQATSHPWRNRLSRSISVNRDSDSTQIKPHVELIKNIEIDDYFFLCTDGVLEQVTDEVLTSILLKTSDNEQKIAEILAVCDGKTKDNYSGILIQVEHRLPKHGVVYATDPSQNSSPNEALKYEKPIVQQPVSVQKQKGKTEFKNKKNNNIWALLLILAVLFFIWNLFIKKSSNTSNSSHERPTKIKNNSKKQN